MSERPETTHAADAGSEATPGGGRRPDSSRAGTALARINATWQSLEVYVVTIVVVLEITTLVAWVSLKSLSAHYEPGGSIIGPVFRSIAGGTALGLVTHLILTHFVRRRILVSPILHRSMVLAALVLGAVLGRVFVHVGSDYASNIIAWLENASSLALAGGPRGVVTRMTLWLALIGASLAAGRGRHINIDVVTRFLSERIILVVVLVGWAVASVVCFAATYGFVDSIAVTKFRAPAFQTCPPDAQGEGLCETAMEDRLAIVREGVRVDLFLLRKQLALDARTLPRVLAGERYDSWLKGAEWNAFISSGGFDAYFPPEAGSGLMLADPEATRMPGVVNPTTGEARNLLIRDLDFILPFGFFIIGLKLLLRILLVLTGQVRVSGEGVHEIDAPMKEATEP